MKRTTTLIAAALAASIASVGAHAVGPGKNRLAQEEPQPREERREDLPGGQERPQPLVALRVGRRIAAEGRHHRDAKRRNLIL